MQSFSHRYDLPADADGLVSGVTEVIPIDGNGLALPFVGPACIVPEEKGTAAHEVETAVRGALCFIHHPGCARIYTVGKMSSGARGFT